MPVVTSVLTAFYLAFKKQFAPAPPGDAVDVSNLVYVSVTGVAIFFMLRAANAG